jgi:hypothetical protein
MSSSATSEVDEEPPPPPLELAVARPPPPESTHLGTPIRVEYQPEASSSLNVAKDIGHPDNTSSSAPLSINTATGDKYEMLHVIEQMGMSHSASTENLTSRLHAKGIHFAEGHNPDKIDVVQESSVTDSDLRKISAEIEKLKSKKLEGIQLHHYNGSPRLHSFHLPIFVLYFRMINIKRLYV